MLIKIILDLFICNVNAQLLEGVSFEIFKAEYIKNADAQLLIPTGRIKEVFLELLLISLGGDAKQGILEFPLVTELIKQVSPQKTKIMEVRLILICAWNSIFLTQEPTPMFLYTSTEVPPCLHGV